MHELEQENARLQLALAHGIPMPASMASSIIAHQPAALSSPSDAQAEVEQLRAQLAQAQQREQALSAQLSRTTSASMSPSPQPTSLSSINGEIAVKQEPMGDNNSLLASPSRAAQANSSNANGNGTKSGASLGLMVCPFTYMTLVNFFFALFFAFCFLHSFFPLLVVTGLHGVCQVGVSVPPCVFPRRLNGNSHQAPKMSIISIFT